MRRKPTEALLLLTLTARVATPLTLTKALSRPTSVGRTTELSFLKTSPGSFTMSWGAQQGRGAKMRREGQPTASGMLVKLCDRNESDAVCADAAGNVAR